MTFIFYFKKRFNLFNIPIIVEHLIEIFLYDCPSSDFLVMSHLKD